VGKAQTTAPQILQHPGGGTANNLPDVDFHCAKNSGGKGHCMCSGAPTLPGSSGKASEMRSIGVATADLRDL